MTVASAGAERRPLEVPAAATRAGFLALLLLTWEAGVRLGGGGSLLMPVPSAVARRLLELTSDGTLPRALGVSLLRLATSYALSLVAGVLLGLALARSRWVEKTLGTLVLGLQSMPSICWLPFAVLWFGLSEAAIAYVVLIGATLAIALGCENAVRNSPPAFVQAARTMGVSGLRLWWRVVLPAAFPELIGAAKVGWTFAFRSLMAAELLYMSGGLGQILSTARDLNDVNGIGAVMVVIVALGLMAERVLFGWMQGAVRRRWGTDRG